MEPCEETAFWWKTLGSRSGLTPGLASQWAGSHIGLKRYVLEPQGQTSGQEVNDMLWALHLQLSDTWLKWAKQCEGKVCKIKVAPTRTGLNTWPINLKRMTYIVLRGQRVCEWGHSLPPKSKKASCIYIDIYRLILTNWGLCRVHQKEPYIIFR